MFGFGKNKKDNIEETPDRPSREIINRNLKKDADTVVEGPTEEKSNPDNLVEKVFYTKQLKAKEIQEKLKEKEERGNETMSGLDFMNKRNNVESGEGIRVVETSASSNEDINNFGGAKTTNAFGNTKTSSAFGGSKSSNGNSVNELEYNPVNTNTSTVEPKFEKPVVQEVIEKEVPVVNHAVVEEANSGSQLNNNFYNPNYNNSFNRKQQTSVATRPTTDLSTKYISSLDSLDVSNLKEITYRSIETTPYEFDFTRDPQGKLCEKVEAIENRLGIGTLPLDLIGIPASVTEILNHEFITINNRRYVTSHTRIVSPNYYDIRDEIGKMVSSFREAVLRCKTTYNINGHSFESYILNKFEIESLLGSFPGLPIKKWVDTSNDDLIIKFGDFQSKI